MRILLTGGAGFIGSHVAAAFLAAGHQVTVVDDLSTGDRARVPPGASFHLADVASPGLEEVFAREKPDVVDHHAAQISVTASARDPMADARVNALGTLNVLECSRRHGVRKVIYISSGGAIYGDAPPDRIPETWPPAPLSPYAIHKLLGEHYLRFFAAERGLAWTALRYANVFGPRQNPHGEAGVVALFIGRLLKGEVPAVYAFPEEPEGMGRDYVYVEDVARANVQALSCAAGEAVNIGTGREVRTRELLAMVCRAMGRELKYTRGGPRPGDLRHSCLDIEKAARLLGWKPSFDLEEGIAKTVAYFTGARA